VLAEKSHPAGHRGYRAQNYSASELGREGKGVKIARDGNSCSHVFYPWEYEISDGRNFTLLDDVRSQLFAEKTPFQRKEDRSLLQPHLGEGGSRIPIDRVGWATTKTPGGGITLLFFGKKKKKKAAFPNDE